MPKIFPQSALVKHLSNSYYIITFPQGLTSIFKKEKFIKLLNNSYKKPTLKRFLEVLEL
jgi:hypothetical protein